MNFRNKAFILTVIIILFLFFKVGFQCGNVRIGKQKDLDVKQKFKIENSNFYTQYYNKNSLLVINLWATWCKPCLAEIPMLNEVKASYNTDSITFLSLSIDDDSVKLNKYLQTKAFTFEDVTMQNLSYRTAILNLLNNEPLDKHILTHTVPKTYFIKNKTVKAIVEGSIEKSELIEIIEKFK